MPRKLEDDIHPWSVIEVDPRSLYWQWLVIRSVFPYMSVRGYPFYHPKTWHFLIALLIGIWNIKGNYTIRIEHYDDTNS